MIKEKELKSEKQYRELKGSISDLKKEMFDWSNQTIFFRILFDLQIYKRAELDQRFVERMVKEKISD